MMEHGLSKPVPCVRSPAPKRKVKNWTGRGTTTKKLSVKSLGYRDKSQGSWGFLILDLLDWHHVLQQGAMATALYGRSHWLKNHLKLQYWGWMLIFIYSLGSCRLTECSLIADDVPRPAPNASLVFVHLTSMVAPKVLPLTQNSSRNAFSRTQCC